MQTIQEKRFRVQNLDCAACAAKIERELLKTEGVEAATLDFANLTLHLRAADLSKALATITRIEPDVKDRAQNPGFESGHRPDRGKQFSKANRGDRHRGYYFCGSPIY
jgi:cation transport ATPase